jgi:hypothetical protein
MEDKTIEVKEHVRVLHDGRKILVRSYKRKGPDSPEIPKKYSKEQCIERLIKWLLGFGLKLPGDDMFICISDPRVPFDKDYYIYNNAYIVNKEKWSWWVSSPETESRECIEYRQEEVAALLRILFNTNVGIEICVTAVVAEGYDYSEFNPKSGWRSLFTIDPDGQGWVETSVKQWVQYLRPNMLDENLE